MSRVHIHLHGGGGAGRTSKLLGLMIAAVVLVCIVLLFLGLWILLLIAFAAMAVVWLVRAVLWRGRAREPMVETHAMLDGQASTLRDVDVVRKESSSSPSSDSKL
jgi:hypothetical protein